MYGNSKEMVLCFLEKHTKPQVITLELRRQVRYPPQRNVSLTDLDSQEILTQGKRGDLIRSQLRIS